MIIIADSGSTKTDWCIVESRENIQRVTTEGTNPVFQSCEEIEAVIDKGLSPYLNGTAVDAVYFYGAGCGSADKITAVRKAVGDMLNVTGEIAVCSDMLAAARALCGREKGIACIMGTGSNSCFYDGNVITDNVSPLGFILGDEGSGACLGKLLVGNILKGQMEKEICESFNERFRLTTAEIIERVYRRQFPNRFLASLSPFILENIGNSGVHDMVLESFKSFITRNVMHYDYKSYKTSFTGSVAFYYSDILKEAANETGITVGDITKSPLEGLLTFHANQQL
jgi:N-acetylglucosamine kinase-like BadF-type ATPase